MNFTFLKLKVNSLMSTFAYHLPSLLFLPPPPPVSLPAPSPLFISYLSLSLFHHHLFRHPPSSVHWVLYCFPLFFFQYQIKHSYHLLLSFVLIASVFLIVPSSFFAPFSSFSRPPPPSLSPCTAQD